MASMSGVVLPGNRDFELREFAMPEPGRGQALIRIKASSLNDHDLSAIYRPSYQATGPQAYQGVIVGQESCGIVEQVGPGMQRFKPGDRVIVYPVAGCGFCNNCRKGWMVNCTQPERAAYGLQRNGGLANFLLAEERTLVALPDQLSYIDGAMIAGGMGTAYAACCRANVSGRDTVLITGMGPVGIGLALLCQAMGARVIGIEAMTTRRTLAQQLGITDVMATTGDMLAALLEKTDGHGCEVAIDCSGDSEARPLCLEAARDWGRVVFIGDGGMVSFEPGPMLIYKQLTLHGSWLSSLPQMEELTELLVRWKIHPEVIVTDRFSLEDAEEAYQVFDTERTGKVVIVFDDESTKVL